MARKGRRRSRPRNFSDLPADKRREMGSRGGKNAHASGNGHKFTPEESRRGGRAARAAKSDE